MYEKVYLRAKRSGGAQSASAGSLGAPQIFRHRIDIDATTCVRG